MKIRTGFVSNSSSSSFLVAWDKKPESVEEVCEILFGNSSLHSYYDDTFPTIELAEVIFNDTTEASKDAIYDEVSMSYSYWDGTWYDKGYKADSKLMEEYAKKADKIKADYEYYDKLINSYTDDEKKRALRQKKLERVNEVESELTDREKEYLIIKDKYEKAQKLYYRHDDAKNLVDDSMKKFMDDFGDKYICRYEFSDNDGAKFSCLEHSGVFDRIDHWCNNNH